MDSWKQPHILTAASIMFVFVIHGRKCMLAASHAAPWWITLSMPNGTDGQKLLHFPLEMACIIAMISAFFQAQTFIRTVSSRGSTPDTLGSFCHSLTPTVVWQEKYLTLFPFPLNTFGISVLASLACFFSSSPNHHLREGCHALYAACLALAHLVSESSHLSSHQPL